MRITGITLPEKKRMDIALTALFGVGRSRARKVLDVARVEYKKTSTELSAEDEQNIRHALENYTIEGELKREVGGNIKRLRDIKSYRGVRHIRGLPVRGQRTKTNSRTRRGNVRKTMGSGKRKLDKK